MRNIFRNKGETFCAIMLLCVMVFASAQQVQAQYSKSGYVGDLISYSFVPQYPGRGYVETVVWESSDPTAVSVMSTGASASHGYILRYFTGYVTIRATYYYKYYITGHTYPYAAHAMRTFSVSCNQVSINVKPSTITLAPGDTYKLSYALTPNVSSTVVGWISGNENVATVSGGVIKAVGPGSTRVYGLTNSSTSSYCLVNVVYYEPTKITLPATSTVELEGGMKIIPTFEPELASADITWTSSNPDVAMVNETGYVTPVGCGTAVITATTDNDLTSSTTVTVKEPDYKVTDMTPLDDATGQSAFVAPKVTYSLNSKRGSTFDNITLTTGGKNVEGTATIEDGTVVFTPAHPLMENTDYILTIPAGAVANKWGTECSTTVTQHFRTGDYEKLGIAISDNGGFVKSGNQIVLSTEYESAEIHYTIDGTEPTKESTLYTGPIALYQDVQLRAKAFKEGYAPSDMVSEDFIISNMEILRMFPVNEKIYKYDHIIPYILFSNAISPSANINNVRVLKNATEEVEGEVIVADSSICFVPEKTFAPGAVYTVLIPEDAVKTSKGEPNSGNEWKFTTGNVITQVSAGLEIFAIHKADGSLWTWGDIIENADDVSGNYSSRKRSEPVWYKADTKCVATGMTHYGFLTTDNELYMWGRQYCGEFGNNSTNSSIQPIDVMSEVTDVSIGGQTTAIIKNGNLYMCGRNDYGQIGDGTVETKTAPVYVMDAVKKCVAGYCSTYAIKTDGTLWAWGRNDYGELGDGTVNEQHEPVNVMADVADVAVARLGGYGAAVLKTDGSLWVLKENPVKILTEVRTMSVGADFIAAVKHDGTHWTWGNNEKGQLGNGGFEAQNTPVKIMENVDSVDCGYQNAIVLKKDGSVWTWGNSQRSICCIPEKKAEGMSHSAMQGLTGCSRKISLKSGDVTVMRAVTEPIDAEYTTWEWSSSDYDVVTVDDRGVVEAKANGIATLTLTVDDTIMAVCEVQVGNNLSGDVNNDGAITMADANSVVNYFLANDKESVTNFNIKSADVNNDGDITMADANQIVNIFLNSK